MIYFAYGSNMSEEELKRAEYCPSATFVGIAKLPGYRLAFSRASKKKGREGTGLSDMVPAENQCVWGVLYDIPDEERVGLNRKEVYHGKGAPDNGYEPAWIVVFTKEHPHVSRRVETYLVAVRTKEKWDGRDITPAPGYLGTIIRGAVEHRLPSHYIRKLKERLKKITAAGQQ